METEIAYFHRRALEERRAGLTGAKAASVVHFDLANQFEGLARAIQAKENRHLFYDVKAICAGQPKPHPDWSK